MSVTALVLCGGSSRRLGRDKLAEPLGPSTVLDVTLAGLPGGWPVVAVGPQRPTERPVAWTVEHPPGGGPLAAIAAGVALIQSDVLVVLAGDMPFAGPCAAALAAALLEDASLDAVAATTGVGGPPNPLLAAYRTRAVRRALPDEPRDGRARTLLDALPHRSLVVPAADAVDVDTPDALAAARRRVDP
jgi:molybdopterin-guanine dinucleotide biosynthesis protein A